MTVRIHSPSSVELGSRCAYAWALRYILGIREREVTWAQIEAGIECTSGERSKALGTAMHAVHEARYLRRPSPYRANSLPSLVAQSGFGFLPQPEKCGLIQVEKEIGRLPSGNKKLKHATKVHGVLWWGKRDLLVRAPSEIARITSVGVADRARGTLLGDYKSTKSISRYAKSANTLLHDVQCNLYALDVAEEFRLREVLARWVYFETANVRRARPVDVFIARDHALEVMAGPCDFARQLETITEATRDLMNPRACGDYGGCAMHISKGGICDVRRSIGALVQARVRKDITPMALTKEQIEKFNAAKAKAAAAAGESDGDAAEAEVEEAPKPVKKRVAKKAKTEPEPEPEPEVAPETGTGKTADLLALMGELTEKQAELDVAQAAVEALHAKIAEVAAS